MITYPLLLAFYSVTVGQFFCDHCRSWNLWWLLVVAFTVLLFVSFSVTTAEVWIFDDYWSLLLQCYCLSVFLWPLQKFESLMITGRCFYSVTVCQFFCDHCRSLNLWWLLVVAFTVLLFVNFSVTTAEVWIFDDHWSIAFTVWLSVFCGHNRSLMIAGPLA